MFGGHFTDGFDSFVEIYDIGTCVRAHLYHFTSHFTFVVVLISIATNTWTPHQLSLGNHQFYPAVVDQAVRTHGGIVLAFHRNTLYMYGMDVQHVSDRIHPGAMYGLCQPNEWTYGRMAATDDGIIVHVHTDIHAGDFIHGTHDSWACNHTCRTRIPVHMMRVPSPTPLASVSVSPPSSFIWHPLPSIDVPINFVPLTYDLSIDYV